MNTFLDSVTLPFTITDKDHNTVVLQAKSHDVIFGHVKPMYQGAVTEYAYSVSYDINTGLGITDEVALSFPYQFLFDQMIGRIPTYIKASVFNFLRHGQKVYAIQTYKNWAKYTTVDKDQVAYHFEDSLAFSKFLVETIWATHTSDMYFV